MLLYMEKENIAVMSTQMLAESVLIFSNEMNVGSNLNVIKFDINFEFFLIHVWRMLMEGMRTTWFYPFLVFITFLDSIGFNCWDYSCHCCYYASKTVVFQCVLENIIYVIVKIIFSFVGCDNDEKNKDLIQMFTDS